jgi:hypothetical protein
MFGEDQIRNSVRDKNTDVSHIDRFIIIEYTPSPIAQTNNKRPTG